MSATTTLGAQLSPNSSTLQTYANTNFYVLEFVYTANVVTSIKVYSNPTAGQLTAPSPDFTDTTSLPAMGALVNFGYVSPVGAGNITIDEFRVGTSFGDVVAYAGPPPVAPIGLAATPGNNSVSLNWNASANASGYNVKRSTTSGSGFVTVGTTSSPVTNYTDGILGGPTYYYVVSAVNAAGESADSAEVSATPTLAAPAAPTGLSATAGEGQVALIWSSAVAATGYNVKRSTTSGAEVTITSVSGTSYTDVNVANGTTYFYKVSATNSVGEGADSSEASATPYALVPVYEPFNYAAGAFANGTAATGAGLTGNWSLSGAGTINASGMTYPNLQSANRGFQQSPGGQRDSVVFTTPRSSGTMYLSFLYNQLGNNGGNVNGLYLPGSGGTSLFVGLTAPFSGTAGSLGLASVTTTSAGATGGGLLSGATQLNGALVYNTTNLIVVRIDFNTSGASDTISLWLNPPAGTNAPGVAANLTYNAYDVGTITGVGINLQGGGFANLFDEIRVGSSYGNVVSAPNPTVVTTVAVSTNLVSTVSWSAYSTNVYQPQSSPDNSTWSNVGSQIVGTTATSIIDPANAAFYQVLEYYPVTTDIIANGNFNLDNGLGQAQNWNSVQTQPPVWINTDGHTAVGCMDIAVTNTAAAPNGAEIQQNTLNQGNPVTPGYSYNLSFWAKQISSGPSYVQQYNVQWLGSGSVFLGQSGIVNFSGGSGTWAHITQNGLVAPAGAVTALIQILGNTGAVLGGYGEVLVDDVSLTGTAFSGGPNILVPTVQQKLNFVATIQTNGITASAATGTVTFRTNSIQLSINAVAVGVANSAGATINPPYTVTAIYSGDATYLGSTGTLMVSGAGPSGPGYITNSVSGNVLTLTWPAGQNWRLVGQTNSLSTGLSSNGWFTVPGGIDGRNSIPANKANPTVFYRLVWP